VENRKKSVYSEIDIKKAKKPAVAGPKDSSPEKLWRWWFEKY
jgi:hypothetical protein